MTNSPYEQWLAKCRQSAPPSTLADRIMSQVTTLEHQRRSLWWLRVVQRVERSRATRWAMCGGALGVGGLPFVYLAHVLKLAF